jgi:hypothetical protein
MPEPLRLTSAVGLLRRVWGLPRPLADTPTVPRPARSRKDTAVGSAAEAIGDVARLLKLRHPRRR